MRMGFVKLVCMSGRKSFYTLTGVTTIVTQQMAEYSLKVEFMFKYGKKTKTGHSLESAILQEA